MRIVVFGTGNYYHRYKDAMLLKHNIVAFLDNNAVGGKTIDNIKVLKPDNIMYLEYDKIVLCSIYWKEMKEQLIGYGVDEEKIQSIEEFRKALSDKIVYQSQIKREEVKKRKYNIMVVSTHFDHNGGSLAALHAVKNLLALGYYVEVAIPSGNPSLINEVLNAGGDVSVRPYLPYVHDGMLAELEKFDVVIVNVFQMIQTAVEIGKLKPVLWWLHESGPKFSSIYPETIQEYSKYTGKDMKRLNVVGVSGRANEAFNLYYQGIAHRVMPFGIDDMRGLVQQNKMGHKKIHFAVIGGICPVKSQKTFVEAVKLLKEEDRRRAQFSIIGTKNFGSYAGEIEQINPNQEFVNVINGLPHDEMLQYYSNLDVVVCCSMEETMCMTIIEGMMLEKATIMTSTTGISEYVDNRENGIIIEPNNPNQLAQEMHRLIGDTKLRIHIAHGGRKLFEKNFAYNSFQNRLVEEIEYTLKNYSR